MSLQDARQAAADYFVINASCDPESSMVQNDLAFIERLIQHHIIKGPCLEIGAALDGHNAKPLFDMYGIEWVGSDVSSRDSRVVQCDFESGPTLARKAFNDRRFETILVFNVLEHVFDPIRMLDTVVGLLTDTGVCVVLTPTVWPLHYYPLDCWRINPEFFAEYCRRRHLRLLEDYFVYVTPNEPIRRGGDGHYVLPRPGVNRLHYLFSKVVHKLLNTFGREAHFPSHVSTAACMQRLPAERSA